MTRALLVSVVAVFAVGCDSSGSGLDMPGMDTGGAGGGFAMVVPDGGAAGAAGGSAAARSGGGAGTGGAPAVAQDGGAPPDTRSVGSTDALPPGLSLTPLAHDFGTLVVGAQSEPFKWFVLTNNTPNDVVVQVSVAGADYSIVENGCIELSDTTGSGKPGVLANWKCGVSVRFRPTFDGRPVGQIQFKYGSSVLVANLSGVGVAKR